MNLVIDKTKCCGCGMCAEVCTQNAITMKTDPYGFIYPVIDQEKCIECGACKKKCTFEKEPDVRESIAAFAAANRDEKQTEKSTSGGIFYTLAKKVLSDGGTVCGTGLTPEFGAKVMMVNTLKELEKLQGSKYVQSSMGDVYSKIKALLEEGKTVLFGGTPCQVAALKKYVGNHNNLLLVDLVCHGTPNNQMFKDYLKNLEKEKKVQVLKFVFRDKKYVQDHAGSIVYRKNNVEKTERVYQYEHSYYSLFLKGIIFRESCYQCPYAQGNRCGDITICDFWGIEKVQPSVYKALKQAGVKAISGILINTERGMDCFNQIAPELFSYRVLPGDVMQHNPQLIHPFDSYDCNLRNTIMENYCNNGYSSVEQSYRSRFGKSIIIKRIGRLFPRKFIIFIASLKEKFK